MDNWSILAKYGLENVWLYLMFMNWSIEKHLIGLSTLITQYTSMLQCSFDCHHSPLIQRCGPCRTQLYCALSLCLFCSSILFSYNANWSRLGCFLGFFCQVSGLFRSPSESDPSGLHRLGISGAACYFPRNTPAHARHWFDSCVLLRWNSNRIQVCNILSRSYHFTVFDLLPSISLLDWFAFSELLSCWFAFQTLNLNNSISAPCSAIR